MNCARTEFETHLADLEQIESEAADKIEQAAKAKRREDAKQKQALDSLIARDSLLLKKDPLLAALRETERNLDQSTHAMEIVVCDNSCEYASW